MSIGKVTDMKKLLALMVMALLSACGCLGPSRGVLTDRKNAEADLCILTDLEKAEADSYITGDAKDAILVYLFAEGGYNNDDDVSLMISKINYFIANGADVNAKNEDGLTPLHWAVWHGMMRKYVDVVKFLVENGADVNAKTKDGTTPLQVWAKHGHRIEVVKILVENGADVNTKVDQSGRTSLHVAVGNGTIEIV